MKFDQRAMERPLIRSAYREEGRRTGGDANIIDLKMAATDMAAASEKASNKKSFTSEKLTWTNLLMMDHKQKPVHRLVGIAIAHTINEDTRVSKTSDRVIADRLGISVRTVITARQQLRDGRSQLLKNAYFEMLRDQAKVENYLAEQIFKNEAK